MHLGNLRVMRQEPPQNLVGTVGVHMHLEVGMHAYHKVAIAHRGQEVLRLVDVDRIGMDEELGAITIRGALPIVDLLDFDLGSRACERHGVAHEAVLAGQRRGEGVDQDGQAETAGIDDVIFFEDGKVIGGALHGSVGLGHYGVEGLLKGELLLASLLRRGGGVFDDRENRALDRLAHGLECDLDRTSEARVECGGVEFFVALIALAQTAQDLGGDDARIAAGAHERTGGDGLADFDVGGADFELGEVVDHHLHGQRHIGARVSVRDGEHVEAIHFLFAFGQRLGGGRNGIEDVVGRMLAHRCLYLLGTCATCAP